MPMDEQVKIMTDTAPVMIWIAAPYKRSYFNAGWLRFTGRTLEQEQNDGWMEGVHPDDLELYQEKYSAAFNAQTTFKMEFRLRRHDGVYRWVLDHGAPRYLDNGTFDGYTGSCFDIGDLPEFHRIERTLAAERLHQAYTRIKNLGENLSLTNVPNDELAAANEELAAANEELAALNEELTTTNEDLAESEYKIRSIISNAPFPIGVYNGREMQIVEANQAIMDVWGKGNNVVGKRYAEVLPELEDQQIYEQLEAVFTTGIPFHARNQRIELTVDGQKKTFYFNYSFTPLKDRSGNVYGVMNTAADVTDVVLAKQQVEQSEKTLYSMIRQAPVAMCIMMGPDFVVEVANKRMIELWGKPESDVLHKPIFEGLPDARGQGLEQWIDHVYRTGESHQSFEQPVVLLRNGKLETVYQNFVYEPYRDGNGKIIGVIAISNDVTAQVRAKERQARLAAIVESSDDTIVSKTLQGIITSWNRAAVRMFGYTQEEAIGKHISLIIPTSRLQEEEFIIGEIRAGNKVDHFETVRVAKDGREIPISLSVSPIIDEQGTIIGASKIARDITDQVAAQESTRRYTERLEIINLMVKSVSEDLDLNKILQKVTDATTELTGAEYGVFRYNQVGEAEPSYVLYTASDASRAAFETFGIRSDIDVFQTLFTNNRAVRIDDLAKNPRYGTRTSAADETSGQPPFASYLAVPVFSRSGDVIGGLFFGHAEPGKFTANHESLVVSIASQTAISIDNAKLYEEVKTLNDKKDEFIGLASHELKTPLTSVNAYLQILAGMPTDDKGKQFIQKALRQMKKLTTLVNDLLDISKIEAGKLQLKIAEFDLKKLMEEAIDLIGHTNNKYRIFFDSSVKTCNIYSDSQRIEQVLINLLTNAIKYSSGADEVRVSLVCTSEEVKVGIQDFGVGIPSEKLPYIFSRFYRVEDVNPNISGLGIGLYLSNEIITRLDGKLWAESEVGKGSTFWFTLPIKKR